MKTSLIINNLEKAKIYFSICIPTYKRKTLLKKLLLSLLNQELRNNFYLEIIVVDNDSEGSAFEVMVDFQDLDNVKFKYYLQPIKNISLTRNMCIKEANGKYICFIDDDETASHNWLISLYDTLIKYNADGVFGFVTPSFEDGISNSMKKREIYFSEMGPTGSDANYLFTGNVMFKKELIKKNNIWFDPEYGLTGGEDSHFFNKLKTLGASFINCREAISYEYISQNRTTKYFLFNRALRGGQVYVRKALENDNKLTKKIRILFFTVIKLFYGLMLFLITIPLSNINYRFVRLIGAAVGEFRALIGKYKILH